MARLAHLGFSATGGLVMSGLVVATLTNPVVAAILMVVDPSVGTAIYLFLVSPVVLAAWWAITPALTLGRAKADRGILGLDRSVELERRVDEVTTARDETLDHSAAEVRRIERDLHDGAQARLAAVGMNVGLAERLMATDPAAAAEILREARESTVAALEDLRSVVRGIHPPVLADRGLAGAIDALAVAIPLPITVTADLLRLPAPVESAAYFAVAECLANTVKHDEAGRAWIQLTYDGTRLRAVVGDDGRGGTDTSRGTGLAGIRRRLGAFDGTMSLISPVGGPTIVTLEIPCASSSPRTRPSSGPA